MAASHQDHSHGDQGGALLAARIRHLRKSPEPPVPTEEQLWTSCTPEEQLWRKCTEMKRDSELALARQPWWAEALLSEPELWPEFCQPKRRRLNHSILNVERKADGMANPALQAKMSETPSGFRAHSLKPTLPLRTGRTNFNPKLMMRDGDREKAEQLEIEERHKTMRAIRWGVDYNGPDRIHRGSDPRWKIGLATYVEQRISWNHLASRAPGCPNSCR